MVRWREGTKDTTKNRYNCGPCSLLTHSVRSSSSSSVSVSVPPWRLGPVGYCWCHSCNETHITSYRLLQHNCWCWSGKVTILHLKINDFLGSNNNNSHLHPHTSLTQITTCYITVRLRVLLQAKRRRIRSRTRIAVAYLFAFLNYYNTPVKCRIPNLSFQLEPKSKLHYITTRAGVWLTERKQGERGKKGPS